ncbi:hypothetical protein SEPCBS57363_002319 [Sporothrix epigloea]|uniref:C6 zinc finger domain containing protein n=1 Tax=Sporothrix epigloea TaxID=1892477 RepID=A0ABP0DF91_9PEZI
MPTSNLMLYQHKSRWQTYLPSLAAWEGVEGCSVNLNPAYDDAGLRRGAIATSTAPVVAATNNATTDDTDSVEQTSSTPTDLDDRTNTTASAASTTSDQGGKAHGVDGDVNANGSESWDEDGVYLDDDDTDSNDNYGEDGDALLAVWSHAVASFVADTASPCSLHASCANTNQARRQQQQQQKRKENEYTNHSQQKTPRLPSPARPIQRPRVAAMTPLSASMLRHYIVEAAPTLATSRAARNPYIAAFLPLAYTDDLVMHCVLAIGGAHLSSRLKKPCAADGFFGSCGSGSSSGPGPAAPSVSSPSSFSQGHPPSTAELAPHTAPDLAATALHEATTRHYSCILRSLRAALRHLQPTDGPQVLRVLAVLLLLSTYECLSWNITGGGVFAHLRASRQLISWLRADTSKTSSLSPDERSMFGALLEIYAYQVLVNRICPDGSVHGRGSAGESLADDHDDEDFVADPSLLQDQDCFGLLFSGLHGLFALIPAVCRLAATAVRRSTPDALATSTSLSLTPSSLCSLFADAAGSSLPSPSLAMQVAALRNRALAWQLPAAFLTQATGDQERIWQRAIGEVYRHGVLVYIETILHNTADHASAATFTFQRHIHAIGEAVLGADLVASRFATILLWPLLIAGSTLVHPDERTFLAEGLRASPQATWSSIRAADVLEKLWAKRDKAMLSCALASPSANVRNGFSNSSRQYFGPHGLAQIMQETNINLCIG